MKIEISISDAQFADGEKLGGAVGIIERLIANEASNWASLVASQDSAAIDAALSADAKAKADLIAAGKAKIAADAAAKAIEEPKGDQ